MADQSIGAGSLASYDGRTGTAARPDQAGGRGGTGGAASGEGGGVVASSARRANRRPVVLWYDRRPDRPGHPAPHRRRRPAREPLGPPDRRPWHVLSPAMGAGRSSPIYPAVADPAWCPRSPACCGGGPPGPDAGSPGVPGPDGKLPSRVRHDGALSRCARSRGRKSPESGPVPGRGRDREAGRPQGVGTVVGWAPVPQ
jgi:hypothetical protein